MSELSPFTRTVDSLQKMLPASEEAEKALVGAFLISPAAVSALCSDLGITHAEFSHPRLSLIFSVVAGMVEASREVDIITLMEVLRDRGEIDAAGGASFIRQLMNDTPTASNARHYAEIVQEKHLLREIIRVCTTQSLRSYEPTEDPGEILAATEKEIFALVTKRHGRHSRRKTMKQLTMEAVNDIMESYERGRDGGRVSGLSTGIASIDNATDGLHPQELFVLAARPSHGKTALAMGMVEHLAINEGRPVALFSLEMGAKQLVSRMLCSRASVNLGRVRSGILSDRDFPAINEAATKLAGSKIFPEEGSDMTIQVLRSRCRTLKAQHGIQAVFIDSLSVLRADGFRNDRVREVAAVTNGLKECAKELEIPVVLIAHLGRSVDKGNPLRPKLSDLRECGNIEQDADTVAFLIREELYADDDTSAKDVAGRAVLRIAKGRTTDMNFSVPLTFLKEFTRFESRAEDYRDQEDQAPPAKKWTSEQHRNTRN